MRQRRTLRDFHRARYGNPLFSRSGAARRGGTSGGGFRPWMLGAAAGLVALGAGWYLFWSPAFRITKVEIDGVAGPTEDALRAAIDDRMKGSALLVLPKDNILVFDRKKALDEVASKVYLDSITLRKKLPGTIEIVAKEKTMRAALDQDGRLYGVDEDGFVLRELSDKEILLLGDLPPGMDAVPVQGLGAETVDLGQPAAATKPGSPTTTDATKPAAATKPQAGTQKQPPPAAAPPPKTNPIPLIVGPRADADKGSHAASPGDAMFSSATMRTILQANARLSDVAGAAIRWFQVDESSETVDADMAGDWLVRLSTSTPFDVQAERLGIVLKDKIGARKPSLEYVDLRYNERIFFRMKDAAPAN